MTFSPSHFAPDCSIASNLSWHFFWADDRTQETTIWAACSQLINSFEDYTLYHYGANAESKKTVIRSGGRRRAIY
jgi:hypothetical protein